MHARTTPAGASSPRFSRLPIGRRRRGLRPDWPAGTCGPCCRARPGRGELTSLEALGRRGLGILWKWSIESVQGRVQEYQVLHKAKKSIQKLEQTLGSLLKMEAESFSLEDENLSNLEEVWEECVKRHFKYHSTASAVSETDSATLYLIQECEKQTVGEDEKPVFILSPDISSPDLVEFERYLCFYKHTVDLLVEHGVVCSEEVPLPEVSTAISHFWQEHSEERRDSILQYCSQKAFLEDLKAASQEPACSEGSVRDSRGDSEEASGSSVSTQEDIMFEDAFDVTAGFLDRRETRGTSGQSSAFLSLASDNAEEHHRHLQITNFLKSLFFANTQICQEEDLQFDYETELLRCTETLDEDF